MSFFLHNDEYRNDVPEWWGGGRVEVVVVRGSWEVPFKRRLENQVHMQDMERYWLFAGISD